MQLKLGKIDQERVLRKETVQMVLSKGLVW